jgi:hypothetical protein
MYKRYIQIHISQFPWDIQTGFLYFVRVKLQVAFHITAVRTRLSVVEAIMIHSRSQYEDSAGNDWSLRAG